MAVGSARGVGEPAATGIPAGDALIVLRSRGPKATAYGVHGATAVVMPVISVPLLVAQPPGTPPQPPLSRSAISSAVQNGVAWAR